MNVENLVLWLLILKASQTIHFVLFVRGFGSALLSQKGTGVSVYCRLAKSRHQQIEGMNTIGISNKQDSRLLLL
jgi:hypothetical protein